MKEKLNELQNLIFRGLGNYAVTADMYCPEWTQPFKRAAEKADELFAGFDSVRENIRKEIEGRFIDGAIKHAERIGQEGRPFEVGRRERRGIEYKVLITVSPVTEMPKMACPKYGALQDDFDGLSFSYCPACGYCAHINSTVENGIEICGVCGKEIKKEASDENCY